MKSNWKRLLPHLHSVICFVLIPLLESYIINDSLKYLFLSEYVLFVLLEAFRSNSLKDNMEIVIRGLRIHNFQANIYLFNFYERNIRKRCEICSKLTIKMLMTTFWCLYCQLWNFTLLARLSYLLQQYLFIQVKLYKKKDFL